MDMSTIKTKASRSQYWEATLAQWREDLGSLLEWVQNLRGEVSGFHLKLYLMFVVINAMSYLMAMGLIFPRMTFGFDRHHYGMILVPVAILGGLFDSLSFYVTLRLVKGALGAVKHLSFLLHLSCDLVIAVAATGWVLFVFVFSGWLINTLSGRDPIVPTEDQKVQFEASIDHGEENSHFKERQAVYHERVMEAVRSPTENVRNILFGLMVGCSAMIPTCVHFSMFCLAWRRRQRCV